jgi:hypothetical protein
MGRRLEVTAFVRPISNRRSLVEMDVRFAATRDLLMGNAIIAARSMDLT